MFEEVGAFLSGRLEEPTDSLEGRVQVSGLNGNIISMRSSIDEGSDERKREKEKEQAARATGELNHNGKLSRRD